MTYVITNVGTSLCLTTAFFAYLQLLDADQGQNIGFRGIHVDGRESGESVIPRVPLNRLLKQLPILDRPTGLTLENERSSFPLIRPLERLTVQAHR